MPWGCRYPFLSRVIHSKQIFFLFFVTLKYIYQIHKFGMFHPRWCDKYDLLGKNIFITFEIKFSILEDE